MPRALHDNAHAMNAAARRRRGRTEINSAKRCPIGVWLKTGRAINCQRFAAPPLISPPAKFDWISQVRWCQFCAAQECNHESPGEPLDLGFDFFGMSTLQSNGTCAYAQSVCCPCGARVFVKQTLLCHEHEWTLGQFAVGNVAFAAAISSSVPPK